MVNASDLIHIPHTPGLTEGGIAYALRSLQYSPDPSHQHLRRVTAEAAVELALRRYLSQHEIPFEVIAGAPFTDPQKFHVTLGGHCCDVRSFLISRRAQISELRCNPEVILKAPALVPSELHVGDGPSDQSLYLFAFISGLVAASQDEFKKVHASRQPHYLVHVMPPAWRRPLNWNPLGTLSLKSESDEEMLVEVSGQDGGRGYLTRLVTLPARTRVTVGGDFYAVTAVHVNQMPAARIGLHCSAYQEAHVIPPLDWGNIWVYGTGILLAGFISRAEFRRQARPVAPNSHIFQSAYAGTKNLAVPISSLSPLQDLFRRVREWGAGE